MVSAWAFGRIAGPPGLERFKKLFTSAMIVGLAFVLITYSLPLILVGTGYDGAPFDPTARLKGWQNLADKIHNARQTLPKPCRTFLLADRRQTASELAFYLPDHPRLFLCSQAQPRIFSQYDLWPGPLDKLGWDALIINDKPGSCVSIYHQSFKSLIPLPRITAAKGQAGERAFEVYRANQLIRWPEKDF